MPDFMAQYLATLAAQRDNFRRLIDDAPADEHEYALRDGVQGHWCSSLPTEASEPGACYAVDGSDAMRGFDNGTFVVISHALLAGPNVEEAATRVVLQRDALSSDSRERLRGLLTRTVEIGLARDKIADCAGGVLYLDGSLYAQLGHLIYPYEAADHADIPLTLLEAYLDLIEAARIHGVRLIALSKTTRGHLLAHALLSDPAEFTNLAHRRRDDLNTPSDGEALARWTRGFGRTHPILVGWEAFGDRAAQFLRTPAGIVHAFERAGVHGGRASAALARLQALPAIWTCYTRLDENDDCLRVECLADQVLDSPPGLIDFALQVESPDLGVNVLAQVIADHT
jgi:hypothetical protein